MVQMGVTYKMLGNTLDNTRQIKDIEAPLSLMVEQVVNYDSILTDQAHSALLHAQKEDVKGLQDHKAKYDATRIKLDNLLTRDARILLNQSQRSQEVKDKVDDLLKDLDRINLLLFDLEARAFDSMDKKDINTAYSLIVAGSYHQYKNELYQDCMAWGDIEKEMTLSVEKNIIQRSQQVIYFNLIIPIILIILSIIVLLIMYFFFLEKEKGIFKKEKELRIRDNMEQKYRTLFENATEAIFIADADTRRLVDCNKAAEKLMGYSRAKLLSMRADDLHPKDKLKKTMEGFQKQAEGKIKFIVTQVLTKNKKRIPVKIHASPVKIGGKVYSQGMFSEIK